MSLDEAMGAAVPSGLTRGSQREPGETELPSLQPRHRGMVGIFMSCVHNIKLVYTGQLKTTKTYFLPVLEPEV